MTSKLELHLSASARFDEIADGLLLDLKPVHLQNATPAFTPDYVPSAVISEKDILSPLVFRVGGLAKYFHCQGQKIGLTKEPLARFDKLVDAISRTAGIRDRASPSTIEKHAFDWMRQRYEGTNSGTMTAHLIAQIEPLVRFQKVFVPLACTAVEREFDIGKVRIVSISKELIDQWESICVPRNPEQQIQTRQLFDRKREELQGYAAGLVELEAEPEHAKRIAIHMVARAASILRVFCPVNNDPRLACYTCVKGQETLQSVHSISTGEGRISLSEAIISPQPQHWDIDAKQIDMMIGAGLNKVGSILHASELTSFQTKVLDVLLIYAKSSTEHEVNGKLVYVFSAIETLLLKSDREPIQQNIGERIAFFIGRDRDARKQIIANTKAAYGIRSKFFHHGHSVSDLEVVEEFMGNAWRVVLGAIANLEQFSTKDAFLEALENMKLG